MTLFRRRPTTAAQDDAQRRGEQRKAVAEQERQREREARATRAREREEEEEQRREYDAAVESAARMARAYSQGAPWGVSGGFGSASRLSGRPTPAERLLEGLRVGWDRAREILTRR